MKNNILLLALCAGISTVFTSEKRALETPVIAAAEGTETVIVATEKKDPLINLPSSIELSIKFPATEKKPGGHNVDLILSKSTIANVSNLGSQAVAWAYEQARDVVHKAAMFTAHATQRDE